MVLVRQQHGVQGLDGVSVAAGLQHPGADLQFVGAQVQDGVVELAGQGQRVPVGAGSDDGVHAGRLRAFRRPDGDDGLALGAVNVHAHVLPLQAVAVEAALDRGQGHALGAGRAVALLGQLQRAFLHTGGELRGLGDLVDQAPGHGLLATHALGGGAEDVGQVVAHLALVGDAGQAAGAGQHAQQRHLGQAHGRAAVIDQQDLVAGQGQLVAATGAGTVDGGQELQAAVRGGGYESVAGLVVELAEVHLPSLA